MRAGKSEANHKSGDEVEVGVETLGGGLEGELGPAAARKKSSLVSFLSIDWTVLIDGVCLGSSMVLTVARWVVGRSAYVSVFPWVLTR